MKKFVLVAGAVLVFSLLYPNGINVSSMFTATAEKEPAVTATPDATIVKLLANATPADKARVASVYRGLKAVLNKDNGGRINTTEKLEELHASTLNLAIETPGKYAGLDTAIEAVFFNSVQDKDTDASVVNAVTPLIQAKLVKACDTIIASAQ